MNWSDLEILRLKRVISDLQSSDARAEIEIDSLRELLRIVRAERDELAAWHREAIAVERERCAQVCEERANAHARRAARSGRDAIPPEETEAHECAAAIRRMTP